MSSKRAVWLLDGRIYLEYLQQCLDTLQSQYPWLAECRPLLTESEWHWRQHVQRLHPQRQVSPRNQLINWLLREELHHCYYISMPEMHYTREFRVIQGVLHNQFALSDNTYRYLHIPRFYGYLEALTFERIEDTIILELEFEQLQPPNPLRHDPF